MLAQTCNPCPWGMCVTSSRASWAAYQFWVQLVSKNKNTHLSGGSELCFCFDHMCCLLLPWLTQLTFLVLCSVLCLIVNSPTHADIPLVSSAHGYIWIWIICPAVKNSFCYLFCTSNSPFLKGVCKWVGGPGLCKNGRNWPTVSKQADS